MQKDWPLVAKRLQYTFFHYTWMIGMVRLTLFSVLAHFSKVINIGVIE